MDLDAIKRFCKANAPELTVAAITAGVVVLAAGSYSMGRNDGAFTTLVKNSNKISTGEQLSALIDSAKMLEGGAAFSWVTPSTGETAHFIIKKIS